MTGQLCQAYRALQTLSGFSSQVLEPQEKFLESDSHSWWRFSGSILVGTSSAFKDRVTLGPVLTNKSYYRCQSLGLGSPLRKLACSGELATGGRSSVVQFQRTLSSRKSARGVGTKNLSGVLAFTDHITVVAYLNKQGGTHSDSLLSLAQQILNWT